MQQFPNISYQVVPECIEREMSKGYFHKMASIPKSSTKGIQ